MKEQVIVKSLCNSVSFPTEVESGRSQNIWQRLKKNQLHRAILPDALMELHAAARRCVSHGLLRLTSCGGVISQGSHADLSGLLAKGAFEKV